MDHGSKTGKLKDSQGSRPLLTPWPRPPSFVPLHKHSAALLGEVLAHWPDLPPLAHAIKFISGLLLASATASLARA